MKPAILSLVLAALASSPAVAESAPTAPAPPEWNETSSLLAEAEPVPAGLFRSDRAFPRFIGPISNPILSKDPRSLTELRGLFISNWIPGDHPLGSDDFQVYAAQVRVALTERLTFFADKDGYAVINPGRGLPDQSGWLNLAGGLKYTFIRDVENQFLVTGGFQWEPQTGEADAFQSHGDGLFTVFAVMGKEFLCDAHVLLNTGYQFPVDRTDNSSFFYTSLHFDYRLLDFFYPVLEFNWYRWTAGGDRGLPPALGEGDGLINLGTTSVAGNNLVTMALGAKFTFSFHWELGVAWETAISDRQDLLDDRLLVELILRY